MHNEADLGLLNFQCYHKTSIVVSCSHHMVYAPHHWISRAPREVLPIWNMLGIFDFESWVLLIFFMFVVYGFLLVCAKVGACYGLAFHYEEIPLFPVRSLRMELVVLISFSIKHFYSNEKKK